MYLWKIYNVQKCMEYMNIFYNIIASESYVENVGFLYFKIFVIIAKKISFIYYIL